MTSNKPQFEVREYVMRDGTVQRPLVKQLTRCVGIRRINDTKKSDYILTDIDTNMVFGVQYSRQDQCIKLAESIQEIIDDCGIVHTVVQAMNSDAHRHRLFTLCREASSAENLRLIRSK